MHYKVKEEGRIVPKAIYTILGVNQKGLKEALGIYVSEAEGANFWLQVLTDLSNRGVKDILIASIDNLKGFPEAIMTIFPATDGPPALRGASDKKLTQVCGVKGSEGLLA